MKAQFQFHGQFQPVPLLAPTALVTTPVIYQSVYSSESSPICSLISKSQATSFLLPSFDTFKRVRALIILISRHSRTKTRPRAQSAAISMSLSIWCWARNQKQKAKKAG